jgi:hypothetical protein
MKKSKGQNSITRVFAMYNKRYFILDLNNMVFYYTPNRSVRTQGKRIPLEVTKQNPSFIHDQQSLPYSKKEIVVIRGMVSEKNNMENQVISMLTSKRFYAFKPDSDTMFRLWLRAFGALCLVSNPSRRLVSA